MEYWRGQMNWPLDQNWKCETCGERSLTWGMINGQCRCDFCHTQYLMRVSKEILTIPQSQLKPEYKEPCKLIYAKYHKAFDECTDKELKEFPLTAVVK